MNMVDKGKETGAARRAFLRTLGGGASMVLGSAATYAGTTDGDATRRELQQLHAEKAVIALQLRYQHALDARDMDAVLGLFAEDAEVRYNGGVFRGRSQGISRLYRGYFAMHAIGAHMDPPPGLEPGLTAPRRVMVAKDALSATVEMPYSIKAGRVLESGTSLSAMARLHGEGVRVWWEGGVMALALTRAATGLWQLTRLHYDVRACADYRPGRSWSLPLEVPAFSVCFPRLEHGPDRLA